MKYAVIQLGGKQFMVEEGDVFKLERQDKLNIDVLMFSEGDKKLVGTPFLSDVKVKAKVVGEEKGDKIRVARFKSKSRYRKVKGHRQPLSVVEILEISSGVGEKKAKESKETDSGEDAVEKPKKRGRPKKTEAEKKSTKKSSLKGKSKGK